MGKLATRMGMLRTSGGLLLAGLIVAFRPAPALCDDLLVMPYACSISAGRPTLMPSQDHGHRIIGAREQRSFRACSPANPRLCREWTIHRFDIDCQGVSVPWAAVAANARPERASYENGRLHIRMPPHWTLAADDPCAGAERWRYGRLQRYCADRRALSPPASVAMPPGFAPLLGIDAIFVTPSAARPPSQVTAHAPEPQPFAATVTRGEGSQAAVPKAAENEPQPAKPSAATAQAQPVAATPSALPPPVIPKIINRPAAATDPAPPLPPSSPGEAQAPARESPALTVMPITPVAADPALPHAGLAVLGVVLVALTAALLTILRARHARLQPTRTAAGSRKRVARGNRGAVPADAVASAPIWSTMAGASPTWNEEVPRTRSDALKVLGMGVTADANLAAIKKIVDGLRQTWHPDLAHNDSDREVREKRMKQINVAWDILAAKPART